MKKVLENEVEKVLAKCNPITCDYDEVITYEVSCIYDEIGEILNKYEVIKEVIREVDELYEDKYFGEIYEDCSFKDEDFEEKLYILQKISSIFDDMYME